MELEGSGILVDLQKFNIVYCPKCSFSGFVFRLASTFVHAWHFFFATAKTQLQRVCGGFLACCDQFQKLVPQKFADSVMTEIHKAYLASNNSTLISEDLLLPLILACSSFFILLHLIIGTSFNNPHPAHPHLFRRAFRFELRHADNDILQLLENTVPPADVERVGIFLQPLKRYQAEAGVGKTIEDFIL